MAREERAMRLKSLTAISSRERAGWIKECRERSEKRKQCCVLPFFRFIDGRSRTNSHQPARTSNVMATSHLELSSIYATTYINQLIKFSFSSLTFKFDTKKPVPVHPPQKKPTSSTKPIIMSDAQPALVPENGADPVAQEEAPGFKVRPFSVSSLISFSSTSFPSPGFRWESRLLDHR